MKRKKKDWTKVAWTPFVEIPIGPAEAYGGVAHMPTARLANSRYDVMLFTGEDPTLGLYGHLSIKDHGRTARHDWRDLQRIKNEVVGPEFEAVEIYPAESRLVDSANQWHLFVFKDSPVKTIGFHGRLVTDGKSALAPNAVQRPFEQRPADCMSGAEYDALVNKLRAEKGLPPWRPGDAAYPKDPDVEATD